MLFIHSHLGFDKLLVFIISRRLLKCNIGNNYGVLSCKTSRKLRILVGLSGGFSASELFLELPADIAPSGDKLSPTEE